MAATRIYAVTEQDLSGETQIQHLVRATSQEQAIRHIAQPKYSAKIPTPDELVSLVTNGVKVVDASAA